MRHPVSALAVAALVLSGCGLQGLPCQSRGVEDYFGSLGTFETPVEALRSVEALPGTAAIEDYERVPVDVDRVDFVYRTGGEEHHRWEIVRTDGAWTAWARSGCLPPGPHEE